MPNIIIQATDEEIKAVEAIVMDHKAWLQAAWDGKVNSCLKRVIEAETDKNPNKLSVQQRRDLVRDLPIVARRDRN